MNFRIKRIGKSIFIRLIASLFLLSNSSVNAQYSISTIAGTNPSFSGNDALMMQFQPTGGCVSPGGDIFISDRYYHTVSKISPTGQVSLVAGNGTAGFSGDGGSALLAQLNTPAGLALDGSGNLYIADMNNSRIRRVSPAGIITTVAGNGIAGFSSDGVLATASRLNFPNAVTFDASGNMLIADMNNHRIRRVSTAGIITTIAGSSSIAGFGGDGGSATLARLSRPSDVFIDLAGNISIADLGNQRIRRINTTGIISTVAGIGTGGFSGDGGSAISAQLTNPVAVAVDASGNLFIVDQFNNRIRRVSTTGVISTICGNGVSGFSDGSGVATAASLNGVTDIFFDGSGNLLFTDANNYRLRRVTSAGAISTIAGNGNISYSGDGGSASLAQLWSPEGIVLDASGNLFIADQSNHRIRRVSSTGGITTIVGTGVSGFSGDNGLAISARISSPAGLCFDRNGNLYIADMNNHRVRRVSPAGTITTIAGNGSLGFSGDGGAATLARLNNPRSIAIDTLGNIYIADMGNNRIRRVSPAGVISTFAGTGTAGISGDGGMATTAQLNSPQGILLDGAGNLYIADQSNHRIRRVSSAGVITTIAGSGTAGFSGDGGSATAAQLNNPRGVFVDGGGNLFIADALNNRIRRVSASGIITTIAGTGVAGFGGDGGTALSAALNNPRSLAIDGNGRIFVADQTNNRVRLLTPPSSVACSISGFNPFTDTTWLCGSSTTLDGGAGYNTYSWSTGAATRTITPSTSGWYRVTVTNGSGCVASDSTFLGLLQADIINNDTTICKGGSLPLTSRFSSVLNTWSTGDKSNSITVSPSQTTTYYLTVSEGSTTCRDSLKVTVSDIGVFNPLADTLRVCGVSTTLDAGVGYALYSWTTGATTQTITPTASGKYKVTVTNAAGCTASDSTYLSLVKADIINKDTTICKGASVTLSIDSLFPGVIASPLPENLRNGLVAYYPFNGNANDESGNNNHLVNNSATLTKDRFQLDNRAFSFNGTTSNMLLSNPKLGIQGDFTFSCWVMINQDLGPFFPQHYVLDSRTPTQPGVILNVDGDMTSSDALNDFFIQTDVFKWYHFVGVKKGSVFQFYRNGILINSNYNYTTLINDGQPIHFGESFLSSEKLNGKLDDIAFWNRALTSAEIHKLYTSQDIKWSTGDTSKTVTVKPTQTTTYYVTVSDGITSCKDSVTITVNDAAGFNPLSDTSRICGNSTTLDAGSGYADYLWSNGATTQTISPTASGRYKVTVTNATGCIASDSTYLSLVKADIINKDTTICKGSSITLKIDSLFSGMTSNVIAENLQQGLVGLWTFNGNANDESGNGNHGVVNGAMLDTDRFGKPNSSYSLDGVDDYIEVAHAAKLNFDTAYSISFWINNRKPTGGWYGVVNKENWDLAKGIFSFVAESTLIWGQPTHGGPGITTSLNTGKWIHYCLTNNRGKAKMYKNGVLIGQQTIPIENAASSLLFGALHGTNGEGVGGSINANLDDIAMWDKELSPAQVQQLYTPAPNVSWSTGSNANFINVSPLQKTTYYVTVSDGISICQDSVTISLQEFGSYDSLQDTIRACGTSTTLDAGSGYADYLWSTGATTQSISPTASGKYKVTVTNASGCSATDSTYLSLVKADIINKDTTICKGSSVTLRIDSLFGGNSLSNLPENLWNGLVGYWPFNGNANDESGNGNHGVVNGAILIEDRFGTPASAFSFDGIDDFIKTKVAGPFGNPQVSVSFWMKSSQINYAQMIGWGSNGGTGKSFRIYINGGQRPPGSIAFDTYDNASFYKTSFIDSWDFYTVLYDGTQGSNTTIAKIYRNGILLTENIFNVNLGPTNITSEFPVVFGKYHGSDQSLYNYKGLLDEVCIWSRVLSESEILKLYVVTSPTITWSTGATSNSITVNPSQTTKYYVTVSDGITSCKDSVTITVNDFSSYNPLADTTRACGASTTLDAGSGYSSYLWNNGATTQTITPTASGRYKVTVTNATGCIASDSTYLSLVKADIINKDTTICKGSSVTLSVDQIFAGANASTLPENLRNGLVGYWPFNGNSNDESGNGYNAINYNADLTEDRFGRSGSAYSLNGFSSYLATSQISKMNGSSKFTIGLWVKVKGNNLYDPKFSNGAPQFLVSRDTDNNSPNHFSIMFNWDGNLGFNNYFTGQVRMSNTSYFVVSPGTYSISPAEWHFVTMIGGDGQMQLYIDGVLSNVAPLPTDLGISSKGMLIGRHEKGDYPYFLLGDIDDIVLYDRMLNASEISSLYQAQRSITWSTGATTPSITVSPTQTTTYYVTVSDGITSCKDSVTITVNDPTSFNPFPDKLYTNLDSVKLDAGPGYTSYIWSNGATKPSIQIKNTGGHRVTVTTPAGCTATDSVFVQFPDTVGIHIGKVTAACNNAVDVPVRVSGFRKMLTMQGSINWDATLLQFENIIFAVPSPLDLALPNFGMSQINNGRLLFSWNDPNIVGKSLADSTILFTMRFKPIGAANTPVPITVSGSPIPLEFYDAALQLKPYALYNGWINNNCTSYTLTSSVLSPLGQGLKGIHLQITTDSSSKSGTTDGNGVYLFKDLYGKVTITPSKSYEKNKINGLSTLDLALIQAHILQSIVFNASYKVIAADANNSSSVTTFDILLLRRLLLGEDTSLPGNRHWAFVDGDQTFANTSNPFPFSGNKSWNNFSADQTHTFRGIKIGDVNYDYNPLVEQAASGDTLKLYYTWTEADDGTIKLLLRSKSIENLMGWQSTLRWDSKKLTLIGSTPLVLNMGTGERWKNDGLLTLSWNDVRAMGLSVTDGMPWLELRFKKTDLLDKATLTLSDLRLGIEAFNKNLQRVDVKMVSDVIRGNLWEGSMRVYPNPADRVVNVEWKSQKAGEVIIRLLDATGKVVYEHRGMYPAGMQKFLIQRESGWVLSGTWVVQVSADGVSRNFPVVMVGK